MKIGLLREGKIPLDERVALTPNQCLEFMDRWPDVELVVQTSNVRRIQDSEYVEYGVEVVHDVSDCDILIGVKEVNIEDLVPGKTFLFFSHTYKQQPYNAKLLAALLENKVSLIDYEMIRDADGQRVIGFGRWAGIVGAYNGLRAWGLREKCFELPRAINCKDLKAMIAQASSVAFPDGMKIVLTGYGRVGRGSAELLDAVGVMQVDKHDFLESEFEGGAVYAHLGLSDYNERKDGREFNREDFKKDPSEFESSFMKYAKAADMFIAGHYYAEGSPYIITREDLKDKELRLKVVADVSCDIDGPVACTIRPSTVADPLYGYDPKSEKECAFDKTGGITVMAVDNLPCELPRDASKGFGIEMMKHVIPLLIEGDKDGILKGARETDLKGNLTKKYAYLKEYAERGATELQKHI
ncbi:MAG: alanine dehydrogenase [Crocinitomicaceae bacterium]|nr:alanine dehydrogenase [Crocinitomicaceae bacterium]|tara:strand:+ start:3851 stop:5086 length:1236 start_codon:yes stop_codon:yes gene_type:complete